MFSSEALLMGGLPSNSTSTTPLLQVCPPSSLPRMNIRFTRLALFDDWEFGICWSLTLEKRMQGWNPPRMDLPCSSPTDDIEQFVYIEVFLP